ncbi:FTR1 family iron permease, partial [Listeria monocytogenes]
TYQDGTYTDNEGNTNITLSSYIAKLTATKKLIDEKDWAKAATQIQDLKTEWLAVEGDVVSQSQAAYDNTERDLMLLDAYINDPAKQAKTADVLGGMTDELKPFADVTYTWFDAALIPFREGLEALLIIATLLTYTKRTKTPTAKRWIIGGTAAGLVVSLALGMVVAFWLSALAFGDNNNLINGWAGLIASIMMLYVSYWLHRNSDITRWNNYMEGKSNQALSNGKMISFAFLAFLAILREGLETVVFLIGMVGRMSNFELLMGILAGLGVLLIIAFVMLRYSVHIPVKPFFMISSAIVFYLCFKFMGSGIHSLQLAGVIPTSVEDYLPSIPALSIYPSWYSFLPQVLLVIFGLTILIKQQIKKKS